MSQPGTIFRDASAQLHETYTRIHAIASEDLTDTQALICIEMIHDAATRVGITSVEPLSAAGVLEDDVYHYAGEGFSNLFIAVQNAEHLRRRVVAGDDLDAAAAIRHDLAAIASAGWRFQAAADIREHGEIRHVASAWIDNEG